MASQNVASRTTPPPRTVPTCHHGYFVALAGMALFCLVLYRAFRRNDWL